MDRVIIALAMFGALALGICVGVGIMCALHRVMLAAFPEPKSNA